MRGNGPLGIVRNPNRGVVLGDRIRLAGSFWGRFLGLQLAAPLEPGEGLWLLPANSIHTFLMQCRLDLAFVDRKSIVVGIRTSVGPWRVVPPVRGAYSCLELPEGTLASSETLVGDALVWEAHRGV